MPSGEILGAMSSRRQGFIHKLGNGVISSVNVGRAICRVINYGDPDYDKKLDSIKKGVKILSDKDYTFPLEITFHCSSMKEGFNKAPTEAFARDQNSDLSVGVFLGINAIYSPDALKMGLKEGIAHKVNQYNLEDYTTAVVVHELGHVLHDMLSTDFFWGDGDKPLGGDDMMTAHSQISPYAATNKKEVVAEVFAAHHLGLKFSGSQVYDLYQKCKGPPLI